MGKIPEHGVSERLNKTILGLIRDTVCSALTTNPSSILSTFFDPRALQKIWMPHQFKIGGIMLKRYSQ